MDDEDYYIHIPGVDIYDIIKSVKTIGALKTTFRKLDFNNFDIGYTNNISDNNGYYDPKNEYIGISVTMLDYKTKSPLLATEESVCWYDRCPLGQWVYGLPIDMDGNVYLTDGWFCGGKCMYSYYLEHQNDEMYRKCKPLIRKLLSEIAGKPVEPKKARNWKELDICGGQYPIDVWRDLDGDEVYPVPNIQYCRVSRVWEVL